MRQRYRMLGPTSNRIMAAMQAPATDHTTTKAPPMVPSSPGGIVLNEPGGFKTRLPSS